MTKLDRMPTDTLLLVADAAKALFLANAGTPIHPRLQVTAEIEAPATHEAVGAAASRPGRRMDRGGAGMFPGRSAMEEGDPQDKAHQTWADDLAAALATRHRKAPQAPVIVVAAPEMLGLLRARLPQDVAERVIAEVPKTLTDMPLDKIAARLFQDW